MQEEHNILSVCDINKYIKNIMSCDDLLSNLWIKGEISNYKNHSSGHMYFTLKDETSLIKCVMFRTHNLNIDFSIENGIKVLIHGYISVYERDGQYQLYAQELYQDGIGNLHLAFLQLKNKLFEEGLFDNRFKKPLPTLPKRIGVLTSPTGSVIRDIINVLNRRYGNFQLLIYPIAVQGESASRQISMAIKKMNSLDYVDVLILARGGGSLEELWAFNEEIVARSIFESRIPIISAIGHETDFTIADFVADFRAPTPSAAAEVVLPEKILLKNKIATLEGRLLNSLHKNISIKKLKYQNLLRSTSFSRPCDNIYQFRIHLDSLFKHLMKDLTLVTDKKKSKLLTIVAKLDALSPLSIMSRGYSIVRNIKQGRIIRSIKEVEIYDELEINFSDGQINCIVK